MSHCFHRAAVVYMYGLVLGVIIHTLCLYIGGVERVKIMCCGHNLVSMFIFYLPVHN